MSRTAVRRELVAIVLVAAAVFVLGALLFQRVPAGAACGDARGVFGPLGTWTRCVLVGAVGVPGAALAALGGLVVALRLFGWLGGGRGDAGTDPDAPGDGAPADAADRPGVRAQVAFAVGIVLLVPVAVGLAAGGPPEATDATGLWGSFAAHYLRKGAGAAGAWILWALAASALAVLTVRINPVRAVMSPEAGARAAGAVTAVRQRVRPTLAEALAPEPEELPAIDPALARVAGGAAAGGTAAAAAAGAEPGADRGARRGRESSSDGAEAPAGNGAGRGRRRGARETLGDVVPAVADEPVGAAAEQAGGAADELPPVTLLTEPPAPPADAGEPALDAAGARLIETLRTFKVDGELVGRTSGPTVTQFEVEPAAGVKVRQIAALADDLALAMRAPSIRIVAPIPGRGAVGVEVPNPAPTTVWLREVLDAPAFRQARAALPVALGKDLEGRPVVADLARMPHLLIAGATGSGKSVCVNTIITSLVYRHTPRTLRFLMVDPKMVELSVYNALPHLRHKVVTDNRDAAAVLKWAVLEMQDRYRLLEANGCRNLQEFNKRVRAHEAGEGPPLRRPRNPEVAFEDRTYEGGVLPYLVVVIDEMADLMMTVQGEVETPIAMLAQKARAIGIHLILATQRPSVNVITGLIKANFPCRIAFRVASQVDSRTIIDGAGAEALLGNGDMLFIPPGKSESSRLQGAFLTSEETERLMGWYDAQREGGAAAEAAADGEPVPPAPPAEPDILETVRALEAAERGEVEEDRDGATDRDARFREAVELVVQQRHGSTSLLQRRLKIGYGRAARLIDQLEDAGVLSPSEGPSRPREVLVGAQDIDRICSAED